MKADKKIEKIIHKAIEMYSDFMWTPKEFREDEAIQDIVKELNTEIQKAVEEKLEEAINAYETWQWEEPKDGKRIDAKVYVKTFVETYLQTLKDKQ